MAAKHQLVCPRVPQALIGRPEWNFHWQPVSSIVWNHQRSQRWKKLESISVPKVKKKCPKIIGQSDLIENEVDEIEPSQSHPSCLECIHMNTICTYKYAKIYVPFSRNELMDENKAFGRRNYPDRNQPAYWYSCVFLDFETGRSSSCKDGCFLDSHSTNNFDVHASWFCFPHLSFLQLRKFPKLLLLFSWLWAQHFHCTTYCWLTHRVSMPTMTSWQAFLWFLANLLVLLVVQ